MMQLFFFFLDMNTSQVEKKTKLIPLLTQPEAETNR